MTKNEFRAEIKVVSDRFTLEDIENLLGVKSAPSRHRRLTSRKYIWYFPLDMLGSGHSGTEGLSRALEALPPTLAEKLAATAEMDCLVTLDILQEISGDDHYSTGLRFSSGAVNWLATAGAVISVDQYVND